LIDVRTIQHSVNAAHYVIAKGESYKFNLE